MSTDQLLLYFYLLLALGVSFLCSMCESGLLSVPRGRVVELKKAGGIAGRLLEKMKENIERPLAGILTLNTIAHTIGAAGVGAQALKIYGDEWVAVVSIVLTILILVFSEIIPKTLGVVYASPLAAFTALTVQGMIIVTYPLVVSFQWLSSVLGSRGEPKLTREEFALLAELGHTEGALHEREHHVIQNLLHLRAVKVSDVLTPRTVVFMLPAEMTVAQALEQHQPLRFSRIPIHGERIDDVQGIVLRHRVYEAFGNGEGDKPLKKLLQPVHAVPEAATVADALAQFVERREHLFLAIDEHGGVAGIVTLEDAIETLLGEEIVDETDQVADMRQLAGALFRSKLRGRRF
jgi:CBS domain containing-hemolysin-like protein